MRLRRAVPQLTLGVFALLAACTSSGTLQPSALPGDGGSPEGGTATGPVVRFHLAGDTPPNFMDVPFPSDAYLQGGKVIEPLPGLDAAIPQGSSFIAHGLGALNGFSRVALSLFAVDDPTLPPAKDGAPIPAKIDPATLPVAETDCTTPTSSVYLLDLAPGATSVLLPCRAAYHNDQPRSATTPVIAVGPPRGYVLEEGHPYAAVLTSRVKDLKAKPLAASADMAAIASGSATGKIAAIYAPAYVAATAALKTALATDGAQIVAIAPYTTMKKTGELFAMRDALEGAPAATLTWDAASVAPMGAKRFARPVAGALPAGFDASLDDLFGVVAAGAKLPDGSDDPDVGLPVRAHDQIAAMGTGVFQAMSYLQVKPTGYGDVDGNTFAYDATGKPIPQAPVKIWATFFVPTKVMPAGGYPTVIVQHGLSGSRLFLPALANVFANMGWMVVGIDSVTFGARAVETANNGDAASEWAASPGAKYKGPDGFADTENGSNDFFGNLQSILAVRDQFRQAGFDTAQLVKLLRSGADLTKLDTGSGAPKIDPARIAYLGDSLGAMEGTIAAAIEPHVQAWFLNVNGGSLFLELVAHSPAIGSVIAAAAAFSFDIQGDLYTWSDPLLSLLQHVAEPGDPIAYASYLTTSPQPLAGVATQPRNALQMEAIWDDIVTDEAGEAIARAAGWHLATPNVGSNADLPDAKSASTNPRRTPLTNVDPDAAGAIHDTPSAGVTAVVVQCGPCEHGANIVASKGAHVFQVPYAPPFTKLSSPVPFTQDYLGFQAMGTTFFGDAFQGKVPRVMGFKAPVRDQTN